MAHLGILPRLISGPRTSNTQTVRQTFSPLAPSRHELEATLDDGRDDIRPVSVPLPLFSSAGPEARGGVPPRLGVGAFYLNLLAPNTRPFVVSWALTRVLYALQNRNSLEQDPCAIHGMLDGECHGDRECAYGEPHWQLPDLRVVVPYTPPAINGTGSYTPPERDGSTNMDLFCKCDTVMYRYASVSANDHLTYRGGRVGVQSSHGMHNMSGCYCLFVSLS